MRPAKVNDEAIRLAIRSLTRDDRLPSGVALRRYLAQEHGSPGWVDRIYRILAKEREKQETSEEARAPALRRALDTVQQKLAQAEAREEAHQTYWAQEVDRLRQRIAALEPEAKLAQSAQTSNVLLRHQLHAAERRVGELEEALIRLERAGEGDAGN